MCHAGAAGRDRPRRRTAAAVARPGSRFRRASPQSRRSRGSARPARPSPPARRRGAGRPTAGFRHAVRARPQQRHREVDVGDGLQAVAFDDAGRGGPRTSAHRPVPMNGRAGPGDSPVPPPSTSGVRVRVETAREELPGGPWFPPRCAAIRPRRREPRSPPTRRLPERTGIPAVSVTGKPASARASKRARAGVREPARLDARQRAALHRPQRRRARPESTPSVASRPAPRRCRDRDGGRDRRTKCHRRTRGSRRSVGRAARRGGHPPEPVRPWRSAPGDRRRHG